MRWRPYKRDSKKTISVSDYFLQRLFILTTMNPTIVFDIETIPDIAGLRTLHGLDARVSDAEVAEMAFQLRRQKTGSDFMPHHLQRVVAISCALREGDNSASGRWVICMKMKVPSF